MPNTKELDNLSKGKSIVKTKIRTQMLIKALYITMVLTTIKLIISMNPKNKSITAMKFRRSSEKERLELLSDATTINVRKPLL